MRKILTILLAVLTVFFAGCKNEQRSVDLPENSALSSEESIDITEPVYEDSEFVSSETPSESKGSSKTQSGKKGEKTENPKTPEASNLPKTPEQIFESMSLEEQIAQLFIVTPEQLLNAKSVTVSTTEKLRYDVGGVVLFSANIKTPSQCTSLIESLQAASRIPLFVAVDEEGGRVARLGNNPDMKTTKFPSMGEVLTPQDAYHVGNTIGKEIKKLGFNLDFAPVADVNSNPDNPVIGNRSFGSDPKFVGDQVASAVKGFKDSGMLCCLKHFPGHGDTITDTHKDLTAVNKTLEELRSTEFVPFASGINSEADFVMLGHLALPKVTGDNLPATMSAKIISILRDELKFNGLIITDSMRMGAITNLYSSDQAAVGALKAGVDVILMPYDLDLAFSGVLKAVKNGEVSKTRVKESVLKILKIKYSKGII